jgi:YHS domain-containing protein
LLEIIMNLIFMIAVVYAILKTIRGILGGARKGVSGRPASGPKSATPNAPQGRTARDPVCGMFVSTEVSHRLVEDGQVLHFCSKNCKESYEKRAARV